MRPWTFPDQLPPEAEHYFLDDWPCIAEWINSLHAGVGTVQFWSWAQLYADFQMMFADRGTLVQPQTVALGIKTLHAQ